MGDQERHSKILRNEMEEAAHKEVVQAMAQRSYHLPNHSYCADLCQYITNTHPLFGICCHHVDHPIGLGKRLIALFGSLLFGLTVSNIFFILIMNHETLQEPLEIFDYGNPEDVDAYSSSSLLASNSITNQDGEWQITRGMLLMWTAGGSAHATFDLLVWYIHACACDCFCFKKKFGKKFGRILVTCLVVLLLAIASFVVLLRASMVEDDTTISDMHSATDAIHLKELKKGNLNFMIGYLIEFGLALLVWYPIMSFLFFSGILGCFQLPILGGRPREVYVERLRRLEEGL